MESFCFTVLASKIDNNPEFTTIAGNSNEVMDIDAFESIIHQDFFECNYDFAYWLNFYHLHMWMIKNQIDEIYKICNTDNSYHYKTYKTCKICKTNAIVLFNKNGNNDRYYLNYKQHICSFYRLYKSYRIFRTKNQYFRLTNKDLDKLWIDFNLDNLEYMFQSTQSNFIKISSFNGKIKINKWLNLLTSLTFNRYTKIKKEHLIQLKEFILDAKKVIKHGLAVFYVAF